MHKYILHNRTYPNADKFNMKFFKQFSKALDSEWHVFNLLSAYVKGLSHANVFLQDLRISPSMQIKPVYNI